MDSWIEAKIFVEQGKQDEVLLSFIKPLVLRLRSESKIMSFHFFREPNNEIRFRVLTDINNVDSIKKLIDEAKKMNQVIDIKYNPYGETTVFEGTWKTIHKFFEAGSEFALDYIDPTVSKDSSFNHIAFSHYFLNPSGFNLWEEANLHASAVIERLAVINMMTDKQINERITQLESRIKTMEERMKPMSRPKPLDNQSPS